jgi:hypothetical protein
VFGLIEVSVGAVLAWATGDELDGAASAKPHVPMTMNTHTIIEEMYLTRVLPPIFIPPCVEVAWGVLPCLP